MGIFFINHEIRIPIDINNHDDSMESEATPGNFPWFLPSWMLQKKSTANLPVGTACCIKLVVGRK